ncbi:MAG: N-acetyltransferase family protein [Actinomycetia bacterium]|nr:N-acetyltransferase family protein [Actinomycetes bacterium]
MSSPSNENFAIRLANLADSAAILEIYAPYVRDTTLTFVSTVPTVEEIAAKMQSIQKRYPYLVCTCNDQVIGFAYANEVRAPDAYRWNAELSIYLDQNFHQRGLATALYTALFQILRAQGFVNLYAVITIPNDPSIALHRHFGFSEIGVHQATGYKLGAWRDVLWMHHRIENAADPAVHGLPIAPAQLKKNDLDNALNLANAFLKGVGR